MPPPVRWLWRRCTSLNRCLSRWLLSWGGAAADWLGRWRDPGGYALGLLLIVPLGDLVDRKRLLLGQLLFSALALVGVGMAPNWAILLLALAIAGLMAVMVQVMVAHAASLASPGQQGQAVGTVTSGVVLGILLARLASGGLADLAGWRSVYLVAAGLLMMLALVLWRSLPGGQPMRSRPGYRALIMAQFSLYRHDRLLRQRGVFGVLIFAAFSVLWSAMVMPLSAAPLALSHTEIGLFGLAGVAGTLAASHAGRLADLGRERTTGVSLALLTLSWLPTAFVEHSLLAFVLGVLMLDFAVQAVHVTNQSLLLAGRGAMASRLIGAYMCCYSLGSGLGRCWRAGCLHTGAGLPCVGLAWASVPSHCATGYGCNARGRPRPPCDVQVRTCSQGRPCIPMGRRRR